MEYKYTVTAINFPQLVGEIEIAINKVLRGQNAEGYVYQFRDNPVDNLVVVATLSASEVTALTNAISNHVPVMGSGVFKLDSDDPTLISINVWGLHKKESRDTNGDVVLVEYFKDYSNDVLSDLAIKEVKVIVRNGITGLVDRVDNTIYWYFTDDTVGAQKSFTQFYNYDSAKSYGKNIVSRENIIKNASIWLHADLIGEYGVAQGEINALEFLDDVSKEIGTYIRGNRQKLLDAIQDSTRAYITPARKDTLNTILDIDYTP